MSVRYLFGNCAVVLLLSLQSMPTLGAAGSEVSDAVMRGDTAAVRALLAQKADVNASQADGATALHWAVYRADAALTDLLLQAGANPKVANKEGATPLSLACMNGNAAIMESLLKAGADPNEALPRGETALMMASRTGNVAAMKVLLDRGAQVNAKESLRGTTALMWAADQGHAAAMQLLIDRGADLNVRSNAAPRGRTAYLGKANDPRRSNRALAAAAAGATPEEVARLAQREPRPGQPAAPQPGQPAAAPQPQQEFREEQDLSGGGLPPLAFATRAKSIEAVNVLLAAGADVNQRDRVRLDPAAGGDAQSQLQARRVPAGEGRRPEHRQQGRLDAALSGDGQPQHREAATIRSASRTWTIWTSSSCCWTRAPTSTRGSRTARRPGRSSPISG